MPECAHVLCTNTFPMTRFNRVYCSPVCRQAASWLRNAPPPAERPSAGRVPLEPVRKAALQAISEQDDLNYQELARRLGQTRSCAATWHASSHRRIAGDSAWLKRKIGVLPHRTRNSNGTMYAAPAKTASVDFVQRLAVAANIDPVDMGL